MVNARGQNATALQRARDREHTQSLLRRYHEHRHQEDREQLLERFAPLARRLARRYARSGGEPLEDLVQVANLGLLKAIDRFDPSLGHAFVSFASPTILGELRRYFRDAGWSIHLPRGQQ